MLHTCTARLLGSIRFTWTIFGARVCLAASINADEAAPAQRYALLTESSADAPTKVMHSSVQAWPIYRHAAALQARSYMTGVAECTA